MRKAFMMKTIAYLMMLLTVTFLAGCVPLSFNLGDDWDWRVFLPLSLHPLYTDKDVIFEPELLGIWSIEEEDDSKETWEFSKNGENAYTLVSTDSDGKQGHFVVHLAKIEGLMFLDLYPAETDLQTDPLHQMLLIPSHMFLLVKQIRPTLKVSIMEPDWLDKLLDEKPDTIRRHETISNLIVLTASTEELQVFLIKHKTTEGAFSDLAPMILQN
jgi:hypothetical protein